MTEHEQNLNEKPEKAKKSRYPGIIILVVLILVSTLTVFIVVNNQLAARSAAYTASPEANSSAPGRGSCCSVGGSGDTADYYRALGQAALEYYSASGGDVNGLEAYVEDFGCHQEITLVRNNTLVVKYSYSGTTFVDITP